MMVAALYVATGGVYYGLEGVDPWDETRDARRYTGPYPVVAHPPCTRWCQLAYVVQARYGYRVGEDGGCFAAALASVRQHGGVLEHPAETLAWKTYGLPRPHRGWAMATCGGWVCEVEQGRYGHPARKRTWLYYFGDASQLRELDWGRATPTATVSFMVNHGGGNLPRLSKKAASATPPAFRDLLLGLARSAA